MGTDYDLKGLHLLTRAMLERSGYLRRNQLRDTNNTKTPSLQTGLVSSEADPTKTRLIPWPKPAVTASW
jgi:hypothetical protein